MSRDATPEARAQLRLRYELMAEVADRYVAAGFTTIVQDVILGPALAEVVDLFVTSPVDVVVLAPSVEAVAARERGRAKTGYTGYTPDDLDAALRDDTPRLGTWIDSSHQDPDETVDAIVRALRHRS
jgi:hypothetical protein